MVVVLPQGGARSRFLFDFNAAACLSAPDQSLNAVTGQRASFTHNGVKSAPDAAGRVQYFPTNAPAFRWDRDPITGLMVPGVQLEPAGSNRVVSSQAFDNATVWSVNNVEVTPNVAIAPDGTMTADKATASSSAGSLLAQGVATVSTAVTYSIYAKQGSGPTDAGGFGLYNITTNTNLFFIDFNYTTGVITSLGGAVGSVASVVKLGNGWWRLMMTVSSDIAAGNIVNIYAGFRSGPYPQGQFAYFWGAQLEAGVSASSYMPTTSGGGYNRPPSLLTYALNVPPQPMTLYYKIIDLGYKAIYPIDAMPFYIGGQPLDGTMTYETHSSFVYVPRNGLSADTTVGFTQVYGDTLETCNAITDTGAIKQSRSTNGGAIVGPWDGPPTTPDFPPAWKSPLLALGSTTAALYPCPCSMQVFRIALGVRSMDYMRRGGA